MSTTTPPICHVNVCILKVTFFCMISVYNRRGGQNDSDIRDV